MTTANSRKLRNVLTVTLIALACSAASVAQGFHVIHFFNTTGDGGSPLGRLISDKQGNLYGTTSAGGAYNYGSVFELTPPSTSGGGWTETILYSFQGSLSNLQSPQAGLVMDGKGNLFGTTFWGGINNNGTVFELSPPAVSGGLGLKLRSTSSIHHPHSIHKACSIIPPAFCSALPFGARTSMN